MENFEIPLEIPDIRIEQVERNDRGDFVITVISTVEGTNCRKCGKKTVKFYGYDREITLRHLPILGHKTFLRIRPKRYACPYCDGNPTTTQRSPWYDPKSTTTKVFEHHILLELVNSTIIDVSIKEDIGYDAVKGIIDRCIDAKVNWKEIERLDTLGIDEISLKKGHKHFVTLITSRVGDRTRILGVLKGRKKKTVKRFLSGIPQRLKETIKAVCSDMYEGYINAVKEVFGKGVVIVIDRFHVAKLYRKDLDTLRKQEMKRLKKELPEKEYKKLKGVMWALRKADIDLTPEERSALRSLFKHSPILKTAYELCDDLTYIFNQQISKDEAIRQINIWGEVVALFGLTCFDTFLSTLHKWMDEVTNYFIGRQTSGFVEGLNNKIKVIKRRCYGIFNIKHLFKRIFIDIEGYSLFT